MCTKKTFRKIIGFAFLFLILFFSYSCKKDNEEDINPGTPDAFVSSFVAELNADTIKSYVQWMQNYTTRFFLADNRKQIATGIKNKFIQLGFNDARIDSFYLSASWNNNTYNTWQYNVIARLEGNTSSSALCVIGAHYDCIVDEGDPFSFAPGANDNASGIAGIIEIARIMKKKGFVPKNSIEFVAFAAEENELDGSNDYVNKAIATNAGKPIPA